MNKKQIRDAIHRAVEFSDQQDAKHQARYEQLAAVSSASFLEAYAARRWDRACGFLASLQESLREHSPEAAAEVDAFMDRVIAKKNPLLDTADSNKEKPE
jgi:hypothetical protein